MKKLGLAIFAVVLGVTIFAACNKKEAVNPASEAAPAAAEQVAPAQEAPQSPVQEAATAAPAEK